MEGKEELLKIIDANQDNITRFCSDIVKISSENPPGDTTRLVDFISRYLEAEGLDYQIYAPQEKMPNIVGHLKGTGEGRRLVLGLLAWLLVHGYWDWIPRAVADTACKYLGFKLGKMERRLSPSLKRRLALHAGFFRRPA